MKSRKFLIAAALLAVLAAGLSALYSHNEKQRRYNEGVTQLEDGEIEAALKTFTELGNFDDSREMAEYADLEIKYLTVEALAAAGKYDEVIEILRERSAWFGDSETGKEAGALADEYETLKKAINAWKRGNFKEAEEKYGSLDTLADSFATDRCLCLAHVAEEDREWMNVLAYLYASMEGDCSLSFLEDASEGEGGAPGADSATEVNPSGKDSENDRIVREAYHAGNYEAIIEVLETDGLLQDGEAESLKASAVNGFHYDDAQKKFEDGNYEEAMEGFLALGDFLDAPARHEEAKEKYQDSIYQKAENYLKKEKYKKAIDAFQSLGDYRDAPTRLEEAENEYDSYKTYKEAKKLYEDGKYYQAKKLFRQAGVYKDAEEQIEKCVQVLPENGSLRTGNGSSTNITIIAPDGSRSVYLKMYNSSGDTIGTIFLRPGGSGTIYLSSGDYTIKVAYGTEWYGDKDLFGDDGSYCQLMNGTSEIFSMHSNYTYTLELQSTTQGNVGSDYLGGADDM